MPLVKSDKLDKRADVGMFLGYNNVSTAYRIFQPRSGKICIHRNVRRPENKNVIGMKRGTVVEFISEAAVVNQSLWIRKLLRDVQEEKMQSKVLRMQCFNSWKDPRIQCEFVLSEASSTIG